MSIYNEQGLLQGIREEPGADDLRYMYADMLEERGDLDHAAFIRVQLALAHACDEQRTPLTVSNREDSLERLRQREKELLTRYQGEWEAPLRSGCPAITRIEFVRGFPDHITLPANAFLDNAGSIFGVAPITSVRLTECSQQQVRLLARSPYLANISGLNLRDNDIGAVGAETLANSSNLANLSSLNLSGNDIGAAGTEALARSPFLVNLTSLDLGTNNIRNAGVEALARSPYLANISSLSLSGNDIGAAGAEALANSATLTNLTSLDLWDNDIGGGGAWAIVRSRSLSSITSLDLTGNNIGRHILDEMNRMLEWRLAEWNWQI